MTEGVVPDGVDDDKGTVEASFTLSIGEGTLRASANLPVGRTTLTQILPLVRGLEDSIMGRVAEEAVTNGTPISCRAGCGACCRQLVPVSLFEAEALSEWLRSLPAEQRQPIEARFHHALEQLRDAGIIEKILDTRWMNEEKLATQLAIDYFHAHVACPFLVDESCSIHPIRPLSCREYVVTSPPALCEDPSEHDVAGVRLPLKLSRVLYSFGQQIEQDHRGWFPLVFLLAWAGSGAEPGDAFAGTGEEVLRMILDRAVKLSESGNEPPRAAGSMA